MFFVEEATPIFLVSGSQGSFTKPRLEIVLTSMCVKYAKENFPAILSLAISYCYRLAHMTFPYSDDQLSYTEVG